MATNRKDLYKLGEIFGRLLLIPILVLLFCLTSCSGVLYVSNNDVCNMGTDGSNKVKLAPGDYAKWLPNSKGIIEIVFFKEKLVSPVPGESGSGEIWIMNKDGTNLRQLTDEKSGYFFSFSPDGKSIAFQSYRDGNWQIYTMTADGKNQTRLTNDPFIDEHPKWSPLGDKIVFQSRQKVGFDSQILAIDVKTSGQTNLSSNFGQPGSFQHPVWSPDGKYIAFEGWLNAAPVSWNIYAVDNSGQLVGSLTGLASGKNYFSPILHYGTSLNNYYIFYQPEGKPSGIYRKLWNPNESVGAEEFLPLPDNTYLHPNFDVNLCFPAYIFFTGEDASGKLFIGSMNYKDGSNFKNLGDGYRPYACLMN